MIKTEFIALSGIFAVFPGLVISSRHDGFAAAKYGRGDPRHAHCRTISDIWHRFQGVIAAAPAEIPGPLSNHQLVAGSEFGTPEALPPTEARHAGTARGSTARPLSGRLPPGPSGTCQALEKWTVLVHCIIHLISFPGDSGDPAFFEE